LSFRSFRSSVRRSSNLPGLIPRRGARRAIVVPLGRREGASSWRTVSLLTPAASARSWTLALVKRRAKRVVDIEPLLAAWNQVVPYPF